MKGIILAGGLGTRMNPATSSTNKHLLPVYSKSGATPMIQYPVNTLKSLGITDILIITSQEHCGKIVEYLGDGFASGLDFSYKIQDMSDPSRPPGIASALKLSQGFTNSEDFIVILGDNFYEEDNNIINFINMCSNSPDVKSGLFLSHTDEWERFGIAKFDGFTDSVIIDIIEKPKTFISDSAVTGMYYYTSQVYTVADQLKPSLRGELEITDINKYYANRKETEWYAFNNFWSDMGTPESMIRTQEFLLGES